MKDCQTRKILREELKEDINKYNTESASPSTPSIKFIELIIATIIKIVSVQLC